MGSWVVPNDGFLDYRSHVGIPGGVPAHRIELRIREPERWLLPLVAVHGRLCHHPRAVGPMLERAAEILTGLVRGRLSPAPRFATTAVDVPRLPRAGMKAAPGS